MTTGSLEGSYDQYSIGTSTAVERHKTNIKRT